MQLRTLIEKIGIHRYELPVVISHNGRVFEIGEITNDGTQLVLETKETE